MTLILCFSVTSLGIDVAYLGLNDRTQEGLFQYTDGSPTDFLAWDEAEPNNQIFEEHFVYKINI